MDTLEFLLLGPLEASTPERESNIITLLCMREGCD